MDGPGQGRDGAPAAADLSRWTLVGFAVAATGGPLALVAIYMPMVVPSLPPRLWPLVVLLGGLAFLPVLALWRRFAAAPASADGLAGYVRAAAGPGWAGLQAVLWLVAYVLYLPYTIADILYLELPTVAKVGPLPLGLAEVLLPVGLVVAAIWADRALLVGIAGVGALQVVIVVIWAAVAWHGGPTQPFAAVAGAGPPAGPVPTLTWTAWRPVLVGAAQVSLLFVCLSLVVFLGAEAAGGGRAIRHALTTGALIAGATLFVGALGLAEVGAGRSGSWAQLAGAGPVRAATGAVGAVVYGVLALGGVLGVVAAEYVAVIRLAGTLAGWSRRRAAVVAGGVFVGGAAIALAGPRRFYALMLPPSLIALYASLLIVALAYPGFARQLRQRALGFVDLGLALWAALWAGYGLYGALGPLVRHLLGG